ncbi:uncharacterized protein LOC134541467 isoform X2 [Bacillus rossius redtenbacheri]|uniref:uncharacterized protein LOC134541467 isoform X2 n=1 Tax=Bacillus rossius redtenbacheri TaxID=93214 RepID=UPI002FDD9112
MAQDTVKLPEPWSAHLSLKRNLIYYYNAVTGESIWSPPEGSVVGGVKITTSDAAKFCPQTIPGEVKMQLSKSNVTAPVGRFSLPCPSNRLVKDRVDSEESQDVDPEVPQSKHSTYAGWEIVSSSDARKRKLDGHSPQKVSRLKLDNKSEESDSSASFLPSFDNPPKKRECTRAATRMQNLQNLLHEIQEKKKKETAASLLGAQAASATADVGRKRRGYLDGTPEKRQRQSAGTAGHADVHSSCGVTSTTANSACSRSADSEGSNELYDPESPRPGHKLPYLDSDLDSTSEAEGDVITSASVRKDSLTLQKSIKYDNSSSSSCSKVVSSSLPVPSAAWSSAHRKEHIRKRQLLSESYSSIKNASPPAQSVVAGNGNNQTNDTSQTEGLNERLLSNTPPGEKRTNNISSVKSGQDAAPDEGFSQAKSNKKVPSDNLPKISSGRNSVQRRLIIAASSKSDGPGNVMCRSREKSVAQSENVRNSSGRASVQRRLMNASSGEGGNKIHVACKTEERPSASTNKKRSWNEQVTANSPSRAKRSVQSRLEVSAKDNDVASRANVLCSKTEDYENKAVNTSNANSRDAAIVKFRERLAALPDDKYFDSYKFVSSTVVCKNTESSKSPHELSSGDAVTNDWQSAVGCCTGYDALVSDSRIPDAAACAEETMEVDLPVSPRSLTGDPITPLPRDDASVISFASKLPNTGSKNSNNLIKWLDQCEPSSPERTLDFFLPVSPTDEDFTEEAMDWDNIEEDLSQVVSVLPTSCAKAEEWFIVVDTNILLHNLEIVEELRDTPFPKLGLPVLMIPWLVLQELDGLKMPPTRGQHKSKDACAWARRAVQFLNSNLKKRHPRVRGQTARDSEVKHYKRQGADDGILQCCLQLSEKGNLAVILTNDKNLANKAIVSGISSFSHDEILTKLHEVDLQQLTPKGQKQTRETASASSPADAQAFTSDQTDAEKTKVDLIFCHLKLLLKDILSEVLTSGIKKMYGSTWQSRIIKKPPWTLSEVLFCILKHWSVMSEYGFRQNKWPSHNDKLMNCANDIKKYLTILQAFLKTSSRNCLTHTSNELKDIINYSIDICIGLNADSFREKHIETIEKLEALREICKEKSIEAVMSTLSTIHSSASNTALSSPGVETEKTQLKYVREKFSAIWVHLLNLCGSLCDRFKIKHSFKYGTKYDLSMQTIREVISYIWPHLKELNKCYKRLEITPLEDLSPDHELITNVYFNVKNFLPHSDQDIDDTLSPQLVYIFLINPNERQNLAKLKNGFDDYEESLMKVILCISENYPKFNINQEKNCMEEDSSNIKVL